MGIFGGKPENKPSSPTPSSPREKVPSGAPPASPSEAPTVIAKDAAVKGELTSESDMLVQGRVEGKIRGARQVIIGETGDVEAQVHAQVVTVRGKVTGDCEAIQKVEITSTGKVFGNISARAIVVAEGATFRGASKMTTSLAKKPGAPPAGSDKAQPSRPETGTASSSSSSAPPGPT